MSGAEDAGTTGDRTTGSRTGHDQPTNGTTRGGPAGTRTDGDGSGHDQAGGTRGTGPATVALAAVVLVPLTAALVAMHNPRWYPVADLAQTELRVRDVGGADTPLIGLAGRIGPLDDAGSHPGPLSFWLLAPLYRLLGGSAWALVASALALHAVAVAAIVGMARRRGGLPLVAVLAAAVAVLVRAYGVEVLVEPWNPHLPVLWWVAFLLALWSVLDGDAPLLVVAVVAGTLCAQTHLPYLGLAGALAGATAVAVALACVPRWREARAARAPGGLAGQHRGHLARWALLAAVVGVVLWTPPLLDQAFGTGNITKIRGSLAEPAEPVAGPGAATRVLTAQLDPVHLVRGQPHTIPVEPTGMDRGGVAVLAAWATAAVVAWRRGHHSLARLHAVLAGALVLGWLSISRIHGVLWYYLFLWLWGLGVLLLVATAATVGVEVARRAGPGRARLRRAVVVVAALATVGVAGAFTTDAVDAEPTRPDLSATLGVVSAQTTTALDRGEGAGGGRSGRYLVRWMDRYTIGSQGFGLVNELERAGFTVGVDRPFGAGAARHRILPEAEATAVVTLVVGSDIRDWRTRPEATPVAYVDDRPAEAVAEAEALGDEIDAELRARGLDALADEWAANLFTATLHPDLPPPVRDKMHRVLAIGAPVAVFVSPPAPG